MSHGLGEGTPKGADLSSAEIQALRYEQTERIKSRDTFVNYNIAALAIVVAAAVAGDAQGSSSSIYILLVIPWISLAFGWTFILNDLRIGQLSGYLAQADKDSGWEEYRRSHSHRTWIALPATTFLIQISLFGLPGSAALIAFAALESNWNLWTIAIYVVEWVAVIVQVAALASSFAHRRNSATEARKGRVPKAGD